MSVDKDKFDKLGFVELEQTLFCDRYLELVETIQSPLCKGRADYNNKCNTKKIDNM